VVREGILNFNPLRAHQQCEVTTPGEDKNKNGKRIPEIFRETQITRKKERKLSKKKSNLETLQEVTKNTSQEVGLQDLNLVQTIELRNMGLRLGEAI
jgi:hypothetical protein